MLGIEDWMPLEFFEIKLIFWTEITVVNEFCEIFVQLFYECHKIQEVT